MSKLKNKSIQKKIVFTAVFMLIVFTGIQFIHPSIYNPPVTPDFIANSNVEAIMRRACYDCHSNETNLRWYDQVAPVYWKVAAHVNEGREALNFSYWKKMTPAGQKAKIWEAINQIEAGAMPLKSYEFVHSTAKISPGDLIVLKAYAKSIVAKNKPGDTIKINAAAQQLQRLHKKNSRLSMVPIALNGIAYIPGYKNWQAISATERFDNGTMRIIFGNDIAVKAIQDNNIHPWPNGTIFAKVAWDQVEDKDGTIRTGVFNQVEYMIKNDQKYASTIGWGFARFKTDQLQPYGKTALFTTECINCHRPQKDEDFVFTQPFNH